MPWAPKRPCTWPGCHELVRDASRCDRHRKQDMREYNVKRRRDPMREDTFYASQSWLEFRRHFLAEHPLCVICSAEDRITPADTLDHLRPIREGGPPLDPANVRAVCRECHSRHHARQGERWGKSR